MGSLLEKTKSTQFTVGALTMAVFAALLTAASAAGAQDIPIGVTYVCSGEHIYIENCNIRDTSDTSNCMVAHPDKLLPNGMNSYTYGEPRCAEEVAADVHTAERQTGGGGEGFSAEAAGYLQRERG